MSVAPLVAWAVAGVPGALGLARHAAEALGFDAAGLARGRLGGS